MKKFILNNMTMVCATLAYIAGAGLGITAGEKDTKLQIIKYSMFILWLVVVRMAGKNDEKRKKDDHIGF